jgi:hypothetical protein
LDWQRSEKRATMRQCGWASVVNGTGVLYFTVWTVLLAMAPILIEAAEILAGYVPTTNVTLQVKPECTTRVIEVVCCMMGH